jgi:hypothetical protein
VAALDLATSPASTAGASAGPDVLHPPSDTGEAIDAQARAAYRQRLRELEEAAAEADAAADIERSARIAAERDALVDALTGAYGLGGRVRPHRGDRADQGRDTADRRRASRPRPAPGALRAHRHLLRLRARPAGALVAVRPGLTPCGPFSRLPGNQPRKEGTDMPRMSKADASVSVDEPEIEGRYAELGEYTVAFETHKADVDPAPLFQGLPDDRCQCPHWGVVLAGRITFRYADHAEVFTAGDAYYGAPGHLPLMFAGTELVEFSPTGPLNETMGVIGKNLEATRAARLLGGA